MREMRVVFPHTDATRRLLSGITGSPGKTTCYRWVVRKIPAGFGKQRVEWGPPFRARSAPLDLVFIGRLRFVGLNLRVKTIYMRIFKGFE